MPTPVILQERLLTSSNGSGFIHDLTLPSALTPGSHLIAQLFCAEDITACNVNGEAGSPAATTHVNTGIGVINGAWLFSYRTVGGAATGFRFTTATSHFDIQGRVLEVSNLDAVSPFIDYGLFAETFQATELDATATSEAGGLALSMFVQSPIANVTSTRSGFTQSSESSGGVLLQTSLPVAGTSVNAGATLSSNAGGFPGGFVATFRAATGAAPPPAYDLNELRRRENMRQLIESGRLGYHDMLDVRAWV